MCLFPSPNSERASRRGESGYTIIQLVLTVVIVGILTTFAVLGIVSTRDSLRLQGSVRELAGYLEKARLDAIRRHGNPNSSVIFTSATSYNVTMDFDGKGTVSTRTIPFANGVEIISTPLPNVNFNWRGRTSSCTFTFAVKSGRGAQSWVDVSDAGDVTVNSDVNVLPTATYATVDSAADVQPTSIVNGGIVHNNALDCTAASADDSGSVSGSGPGCTDSGTPSALSIRKSGASTGSISIHATNTGTVSADAPINLTVTPSSQAVSGGGSAAFTVTSLNGTRGTFAVNFTTPCTTLTVLVTVTN